MKKRTETSRFSQNKKATHGTRAEAIISVADPQFREQLIQDAQKMGIWRRSNKIHVNGVVDGDKVVQLGQDAHVVGVVHRRGHHGGVAGGGGEPTDVDRAVAKLIVEQIPNGACLQLGIGGMPNTRC